MRREEEMEDAWDSVDTGRVLAEVSPSMAAEAIATGWGVLRFFGERPQHELDEDFNLFSKEVWTQVGNTLFDRILGIFEDYAPVGLRMPEVIREAFRASILGFQEICNRKFISDPKRLRTALAFEIHTPEFGEWYLLSRRGVA